MSQPCIVKMTERTLTPVISEAEAEHQIQTNLFGPLYTIQAALPGMRGQGSGTIINISSIAGQDAQPSSRKLKAVVAIEYLGCFLVYCAASSENAKKWRNAVSIGLMGMFCCTPYSIWRGLHMTDRSQLNCLWETKKFLIDY